MSSDLQSALREMLAERAADVTTLPERLKRLESGHELDPTAPVELPGPRAAGHRRWLLTVAAAAVVLLVAAGLTAHQVSGQQHRPASPDTAVPTGTPASRTPSPSPSTSPVATAPLACQARLPQAWQNAMSAAGSTYGAQSTIAVAVAANGDLLVERDFGRGKQRDLALVSDGGTVRSVFQVPDPDQLNVRNAYLSGNWLVVSLFVDPRPPKHTIPGDSSIDLSRLYVVDLASGAQREIASTTPAQERNGGRTIDDAIELNGVAYWDVRPRSASDAGVIRSYDLRSGKTRTLFSGPVGYFVYSAAGIEANGSVIVHAPLPETVQDALNPRFPLYVGTDGTSYAWLASRDEIAWWTPGQEQPRHLRLPQGVTVPDFPTGFLVVSGHYVIVANGQLVDLKTGAVAPLAVPGHLSSLTLGRPDLLVGFVEVGQGHWDSQDYWVDAPEHALAFDPGSLPDLRC